MAKELTNEDFSKMTEEEKRKYLDSLQAQADAEDAAFNANLSKQKELNPVSKQKFPSKYLTQEQVQAQNASEENKPQFTEAGKFGKKIGEGISSALGSSLGYVGDVVNKYYSEPILNLPAVVGNISNAGMEAVAGAAGYPLNLGRYGKTTIPSTNFPEEYPPESPEKPQPLSTQEPEKKVTPAPKEALKKAYAVVFSGNKDQNKTFSSLEEAKNYYAQKGGTKGGIITLSPQKNETAQEQAERIAYSQTSKQSEDRRALKQKLTETGKQAWAKAKEARDAENEANRAKFEKFKSGVSERDTALNAYNEFNKSQGLLNKAYNKALAKGNYEKAFLLNEQIKEMKAGVPKEMGARQQYFKEQAPIEKQLAIEEENKRKQDIADEFNRFKTNRLLNERYNQSRSASNPDAAANQYSSNSGFNLTNINQGYF